MARRSPPKQKCLPAPVSTTARISGSASQRSAADSSSRASSSVSALLASGRFSVSVATRSRMSTATIVCMPISSVRSSQRDEFRADSGLLARLRPRERAQLPLEIVEEPLLLITVLVREKTDGHSVHHVVHEIECHIEILTAFLPLRKQVDRCAVPLPLE